MAVDVLRKGVGVGDRDSYSNSIESWTKQQQLILNDVLPQLLSRPQDWRACKIKQYSVYALRLQDKSTQDNKRWLVANKLVHGLYYKQIMQIYGTPLVRRDAFEEKSSSQMWETFRSYGLVAAEDSVLIIGVRGELYHMSTKEFVTKFREVDLEPIKSMDKHFKQYTRIDTGVGCDNGIGMRVPLKYFLGYSDNDGYQFANAIGMGNHYQGDIVVVDNSRTCAKIVNAEEFVLEYNQNVGGWNSSGEVLHADAVKAIGEDAIEKLKKYCEAQVCSDKVNGGAQPFKQDDSNKSGDAAKGLELGTAYPIFRGYNEEFCDALGNIGKILADVTIKYADLGVTVKANVPQISAKIDELARKSETAYRAPKLVAKDNIVYGGSVFTASDQSGKRNLSIHFEPAIDGQLKRFNVAVGFTKNGYDANDNIRKEHLMGKMVTINPNSEEDRAKLETAITSAMGKAKVFDDIKRSEVRTKTVNPGFETDEAKLYVKVFGVEMLGINRDPFDELNRRKERMGDNWHSDSEIAIKFLPDEQKVRVWVSSDTGYENTTLCSVKEAFKLYMDWIDKDELGSEWIMKRRKILGL